ncbi:MAG TPA: general secretion pathway protein GspB [Verrucomicrobiae bacterium]|nr:general secretion pathway protein GspB [Verrucomicrobiae bacterium]
MSLINEALKRTRDAASTAAALSPVPASYRIESKVESSGAKGNFLVTILVSGVILVTVIVLGSRIAEHVQNVQDGFASNSDAPVVERKPTLRAIKPATEPAPMPEVSPRAEMTPPSALATTTDTKTAEDQIVNKLMERIKAEQVVASKSGPADLPKLVLQGITYAKDGSEAMINNQTVREGDDIEGARVVTIENRRVKLDLNGREITLRLP